MKPKHLSSLANARPGSAVRKVVEATVGVLLLITALCLCGHTACAQLTWEEREIVAHSVAGERQVDVTFKYRNAGSQTVEFKKVETSCGCTTTEMQGNRCQPGEAGTLKVSFKFGGRVGAQHKQIVVHTTDPQAAMVLLTLHVMIPEAVELSDRHVAWTAGGENLPKTVQIKVANHALNVTGVNCKNPHFTCQLTTVEPGVMYQLTVQPKTTSQADNAFVAIETDSPETPLLYVQANVSDK